MKGLRAVAGLFLLGGTVRLAATRPLFDLFGMGELWSDAPYFVYVYRVLGAFVILTGLYLWSLAREGAGVRHGLRAVEWGLALTGVVMLVTGLRTGLPIRFYVPDALFCGVVVLLLRRWRADEVGSTGEIGRPASGSADAQGPGGDGHEGG